MTNKLVVIVNSMKVTKIKTILLYEMIFLLPNYSCLQNPWLGGYCPQIPVLSDLCPEFVEPPPNKIPGYATCWGRSVMLHSKNYTNYVVQVDIPLLIALKFETCIITTNESKWRCLQLAPLCVSWTAFISPEKKVAAPIFYPDRAVAKSRLLCQMIASKHTKAAPQLQAMPTKQTALSPAATACHTAWPFRSRACSGPLESHNDWSLSCPFWFSVDISHSLKPSGCCMHDFL